MKVLIAGPGTGKTTRVKSIIDEGYATAKQILVLSFTNATVRDLKTSFSTYTNVVCYTLHSYAMKINHQRNLYILDWPSETPIMEKFAKDLELDFAFLCAQLSCITFDAMISDCLQFLKTNPVYSREQVGELDLLIVDEYQDFNENERSLVDQITQHAKDTIILGDDDQSIYGFKDADPDGIIELYESESTERLDHDNICHRCPDVIVETASKLIANNRHRLEKPWEFSGREGEFYPLQFLTQQETNEFIISEIQKIQNQKHDSSFLLLSPVSFYVDQLVELLIENGIDIVNFWDSTLDPELYNRIWWLRVIFSRQKLLNLIFLSRVLTPHYRKRLNDVLNTAIREGVNHHEIVSTIAGFYSQPFIDYLEDPPDFDDFTSTHPEYTELIDRLDSDNIDRSFDELIKDFNPQKVFDKKAVNIMSIHKSKGLEADVVFINGLVDGVLPNDTTGLDTIEAQRRLLFVGLTRTCRVLYLLSPIEWEGKYVNRIGKDQFNYDYRTKVYRGQTSRFVQEIL